MNIINFCYGYRCDKSRKKDLLVINLYFKFELITKKNNLS